MEAEKIYKLWIESSYVDEETKEELKKISGNKNEIEDRFYKELEFGTGGLRGIIGAGSNRMNIYTVGKATQGLSDYLKNTYKDGISVAIAYDSRIMSKDFALKAGLTLCANGIKVFLFESLRPTPMLSYTVRHLNCKAGIVITASHNPKIYNGYKVYGEDGGQVTDKAAADILSCIKKIADFSMINEIGKDKALKERLLNIIGEDVDRTYYEKVKSLIIRKELVKEKAGELNIIYTPIHGSGNIPVRTVLNELGFKNLHVVKEQEKPDGNFPTAPYPNPENSNVFNIAVKMAEDIKPDIIFGTDPDCDRIGVLALDNENNYHVLTGNQTGSLLAEYIVSSLRELNKLPKNGAIVKTIVTTEIARKIADSYGVDIIDVLTGFKYIGEKIKEFQKTGEKKFLFGFEESYGCLVGEFVRDKDAVIASSLICEMALYYKTKGLTLYNALLKLYDKYGYYKETLNSIELKGKEGHDKIIKAINTIRNAKLREIDGQKVEKFMDYEKQKEYDYRNDKEVRIDLPKSDVLKFILEDGSWFVIRPSGTEPKMKMYTAVVGKSIDDSEKKIEEFNKNVMELVKKATE